MGKEDPLLTRRIFAFAQPPTVKGSIKNKLVKTSDFNGYRKKGEGGNNFIAP